MDHIFCRFKLNILYATFTHTTLECSKVYESVNFHSTVYAKDVFYAASHTNVNRTRFRSLPHVSNNIVNIYQIRFVNSKPLTAFFGGEVMGMRFSEYVLSKNPSANSTLRRQKRGRRINIQKEKKKTLG